MCILRSLPEKTKLDFDQDLKTCLIFCFEKMAIELNTWDENMHQEKKMYYGNFFYFRAKKKLYKIRFQKIKIGPLKGFEKKAFL